MLDTITIDRLEPFISGEISKAPLCGVQQLDEFLRWKRNLTIIGGCANTGKTHGWLWVLHTWAMHLKEHPKFLLFTNENDNAEMFVMLLEWYWKKPITKQSREHILEALKWTNEHFQFLPTDYKTNLEKLLYKAKQVKDEIFNFDGFFIDPYNSLQVASYYEHYENAGKMRGFVDKQNVKLMISMHVLSEAQRTRDKDGNIKVPHIAQLEHGSMWFNRSDDAITIHRQTQHKERKYVTELHVQKIKHCRSGGSTTNHDEPIELFYDMSYGGFKWEDAAF